MWIKSENPATEQIYNEDLMDEPVDFSDNNTANVPSEVGEALVEEYDSIVPKNDETEDTINERDET